MIFIPLLPTYTLPHLCEADNGEHISPPGERTVPADDRRRTAGHSSAAGKDSALDDDAFTPLEVLAELLLTAANQPRPSIQLVKDSSSGGKVAHQVSQIHCGSGLPGPPLRQSGASML